MGFGIGPPFSPRRLSHAARELSSSRILSAPSLSPTASLTPARSSPSCRVSHVPRRVVRFCTFCVQPFARRVRRAALHLRARFRSAAGAPRSLCAARRPLVAGPWFSRGLGARLPGRLVLSRRAVCLCRVLCARRRRPRPAAVLGACRGPASCVALGGCTSAAPRAGVGSSRAPALAVRAAVFPCVLLRSVGFPVRVALLALRASAAGPRPSASRTAFLASASASRVAFAAVASRRARAALLPRRLDAVRSPLSARARPTFGTRGPVVVLAARLRCGSPGVRHALALAGRAPARGCRQRPPTTLAVVPSVAVSSCG